MLGSVGRGVKGPHGRYRAGTREESAIRATRGGSVKRSRRFIALGRGGCAVAARRDAARARTGSGHRRRGRHRVRRRPVHTGAKDRSIDPLDRAARRVGAGRPAVPGRLARGLPVLLRSHLGSVQGTDVSDAGEPRVPDAPSRRVLHVLRCPGAPMHRVLPTRSTSVVGTFCRSTRAMGGPTCAPPVGSPGPAPRPLSVRTGLLAPPAPLVRSRARRRRTPGLWGVLFRAGVDVVLNSHEHNYERFALLGPTGAPRRDGIGQFVVGTGGAPSTGFRRTATVARSAGSITDTACSGWTCIEPGTVAVRHHRTNDARPGRTRCHS